MKNKLVEFQIQGKFKQKPKGILYMGVELPGPPLRLGLVMGTTVKLCLGFASGRIMNLHWSLGASGKDAEVPHMVYRYINILILPPFIIICFKKIIFIYIYLIVKFLLMYI